MSDAIARRGSGGGTSRRRRRYETTKTLHRREPDYRRPGLVVPEVVRDGFLRRLSALYGEAVARQVLPELERICRVHYAHKPAEMIERERDFDPLERFTEEDAVLITYGDLIRGTDRSPLTTLAKFCGLQLQGAVNTLHILPFFPYSSDRGFAIVDFETVDPRLGTWEDIEDLESRFQLMFDGVINHVSAKSRWFQEFLNGNPEFRDFFISFRTPEELRPEHRRLIFRPRTGDVLTPVHTIDGPRQVWTTFSPDQVDLNYQNPRVLLRVIEILLYYVRRGADILRLDAVTYLWARLGTPCVHLEETHQVIRLLRDVLRLVAPHVALITETNVPHRDNVSYFGTGTDEAHMVYNFALPPLVLHTLTCGDATALSRWAEGLEPPAETATFFNFLDSHDGIGLLAVREILSPDDLDRLVRRTRSHGGLVSYRTEPDGTETPYELNITWFSALNREDDGDPPALQVERFLASRAIALVLKGVPAIYLHSLFGTRNDRESVRQTHANRDINRTVLDYDAVLSALDDPESVIARINAGITHLLRVRARHRAFHPRGVQRVLAVVPGLFAVARTPPEGGDPVVTLTNVTDRPCRVTVPRGALGGDREVWVDLLGSSTWTVRDHGLDLRVLPYGRLWLTPAPLAPTPGRDY